MEVIVEMKDKLSKLDTDLYCITASEHSRGRDNIEVVMRMIDSGIKIVQYREKDKSMLEKYRECVKIRELTAGSSVTFIVNDHIDIALSVEADGVHLGQDDMPLDKARELVGRDMIIGISTHSPQQLREAVKGGADYIGVGPIFETHTKKDVCAPVGFEYLEYAVKNAGIPFVAIGGIKLHNIHEVKKRGAECISLVTEITGAEDIGKMIGDIRKILKEENANGLQHPDGSSAERNCHSADERGCRKGRQKHRGIDRACGKGKSRDSRK